VDGTGIDDLVTRVHVIHSSLEDAGWSTQILCSVFGFAPRSGPEGANDTEQAMSSAKPSAFLVYLAKRGTFYPFAPTGNEQRDNELELRLKSTIGADLPIEEDLSRWFPLWDMPLN
jgi:hypothetical protein